MSDERETCPRCGGRYFLTNAGNHRCAGHHLRPPVQPPMPVPLATDDDLLSEASALLVHWVDRASRRKLDGVVDMTSAEGRTAAMMRALILRLGPKDPDGSSPRARDLHLLIGRVRKANLSPDRMHLGSDVALALHNCGLRWADVREAYHGGAADPLRRYEEATQAGLWFGPSITPFPGPDEPWVFWHKETRNGEGTLLSTAIVEGRGPTEGRARLDALLNVMLHNEVNT